MAILFLDDIRTPWANGYIGASWAHTADEAIALFRSGIVTFASLDHDLSEMAAIGQREKGEKTGYTVVCWLEEHPECWPVDGVRVHSANPVGRERMLVVIRRHYGRDWQ